MFLTRVNFANVNPLKNINFAGVHNHDNFASNPAIDDFLNQDSFIPSEVKDAIKEADKLKSQDKEKYNRYLALTVVISDDNNPLYNLGKSDDELLHRAFTPDEAIAVVKPKHPLPDEKLPVFLRLKDEFRLDNTNAILIAKMEDSHKYIKKLSKLTTPNDDGTVSLNKKDGRKIILARPLTIKEAIPALKMNVNKIKLYQEILDKGLNIKKAKSIVQDTGDAYRFLMLTTENKDGKIGIKDNAKASLPRVLTADEAYLAVKSDLSFAEIKYQLEHFDTIYKESEKVGAVLRCNA